MELRVRESSLQEASGEPPCVLVSLLSLCGLLSEFLIPRRRVILTIQAALERTQFPDKGGGSQTDAALGFSSGSHDDEW